MTPLGLAAVGGQTDIVKALLEAGADPNQLVNLDIPPLSIAAEAGDADIVRLLLKHGATQVPQPPSKDDPAIVVAARNGHVHLLRLMHEEFGVGLDVVGVEKITPLAAAVEAGQHACFEYLLEKGADFRAPDWLGNSLLTVAARADNDDAALILLRRGLPVDGASNGVTPLMTTAMKDAHRVARLLLDHGAMIEAETPAGTTARMIAHRENAPRVAELIDAEARRRHLIAVDKDAAHAHAGVAAALKVSGPLRFRKPQPR
jgi:ankyrin